MDPRIRAANGDAEHVQTLLAWNASLRTAHDALKKELEAEKQKCAGLEQEKLELEKKVEKKDQTVKGKDDTASTKVRKSWPAGKAAPSFTVLLREGEEGWVNMEDGEFDRKYPPDNGARMRKYLAGCKPSREMPKMLRDHSWTMSSIEDLPEDLVTPKTELGPAVHTESPLRVRNREHLETPESPFAPKTPTKQGCISVCSVGSNRVTSGMRSATKSPSNHLSSPSRTADPPEQTLSLRHQNRTSQAHDGQDERFKKPGRGSTIPEAKTARADSGEDVFRVTRGRSPALRSSTPTKRAPLPSAADVSSVTSGRSPAPQSSTPTKRTLPPSAANVFSVTYGRSPAVQSSTPAKRAQPPSDSDNSKQRPVCVQCWNVGGYCTGDRTCITCRSSDRRCIYIHCRYGLSCRNRRCVNMHPGQYDDSWCVERGSLNA